MKNLNIIYFFSVSILIIQFSASKSMCGSKQEKELSPSETDSLVLQKLKQIDKKKYIGLSVDSFLKDSIVSKYKSYRFVDEPIGILNRLLLVYSKKVWLEIYVNEYNFVKERDMNRNWSFPEYRKEKIAEIGLVYNHKVVENVE